MVVHTASLSAKGARKAVPLDFSPYKAFLMVLTKSATKLNLGPACCNEVYSFPAIAWLLGMHSAYHMTITIVSHLMMQ